MGMGGGGTVEVRNGFNVALHSAKTAERRLAFHSLVEVYFNIKVRTATGCVELV